MNLLWNLIFTRRFDLDTSVGRSHHRYARALQTAITAAGARAVTMLAGLALIPLLLQYLGSTQFGIWATCHSMLAIMAYADLGIGNGLLNAIASANARRDDRAATAMLSSALAMLCAIASVAAALALLAWHFLPLPTWLSRMQDGRPSDAAAGLAVFVAYSIVALPLSCGDRLAAAFQEGFASNLFRALAALASLFFTYLAIRRNCSFPVICAATLLSSALALGGTFAWQLRSRPWLCPRLSLVTREMALRLGGSGTGFFLVQLVALVGFNLDTMIVARYLGAAEVATFTVVSRLFTVVTVVVSAIVMPLWPAYADAKATHDTDWLKKTFSRSLTLAASLSFVASAILAACGPWLISIWVGDRAAPDRPLIYIFAAWTCVLSIGMAFSTFLNGMHWLRFQLLLGAAFAFVSLVGKCYFAMRGSMVGIVATNLVCYSMLSLVPGLWFTHRAISHLGTTRTA